MILTGRPPAAGSGLLRTPAGWKTLPSSCALPSVAPAAPLPSPATTAVDYAFVGVAVDGTLVSADADLAPFLGSGPDVHDVRLMAVALVAAPPPAWNAGASLTVKASDDSCSCEGASHFAGAARSGATLAFSMRAPRSAAHVHAIDFVSEALGDPRLAVRESNDGLVIDGLPSLLDGVARPLTFHVVTPAPVAVEVAPLEDVCTFAVPEVTPSPVDFGVATYGTPASRVVHVVNRAAVDLETIVGARTVPLPARGAIDLALRWTPDGDATRCETQTRDESILFLPAWRDPSRDAAVPSGRRARVLETIRTGRAHVTRAEHFEQRAPALRAPTEPRRDPVPSDWSCPRDYKVTSCRAENRSCGDGHGCTAPGDGVTAETRGTDGCHFGCSAPASGAASCQFDAVMDCALACPE